MPYPKKKMNPKQNIFYDVPIRTNNFWYSFLSINCQNLGKNIKRLVKRKKYYTIK